jgi:hypothetical protein
MTKISSQRILAWLGWATFGICIWFYAVVSVWNMSSLGGGDLDTFPEYVAAQITHVKPMRPACRTLVKGLAEAETRAKVTLRRPTGQMFSDRRDVAVQGWLDAGCPTSVAPGIAFGAAEAARAITGRS